MQALLSNLTLNGNTRVSRVVTLPRGEAGIVETLRLMAVNVLASQQVPSLIQLASTITAGVRGKDWRAEAAAVQSWVRQHIRYTRDPAALELIQSPRITLERRQGDCDDHSQLVAVLLSCLGHEVRFVAVGPVAGRYNHVYAETLINGAWTAVETTEPWALGQQPPAAKQVARLIYPVANAHSDELSQLGFLKKIGKLVSNTTKQVGRTVRGTIQTIKQDPAGFLTNAARATAGDPSGLLMQAAAGAQSENARIAMNKAVAAQATIYSPGVSTQAAPSPLTVATPGVSVQPVAVTAMPGSVPEKPGLMHWWSGLSTPEKIGVGAGAGVGGILVLKAISQ